MEDITVEDLKSRLEKNEKFVFLDVREEWEYEDDNLGAINIPLA
ncbi:MAG: rhodanese-like domain-containing protein, partial [Algoriphagus sp.]